MDWTKLFPILPFLPVLFETIQEVIRGEADAQDFEQLIDILDRVSNALGQDIPDEIKPNLADIVNGTMGVLKHYGVFDSEEG